MIPTTDGGYILTTRSNSTDGDLTFNHGSLDVWVVKLDVLGSISWQKSFGGSGSDIANSIVQTTDGGYIIAGYTASGDGDVTQLDANGGAWVMKIDASGNKLWDKTFGGNFDDYAYSIIQTADGGYAFAGYTSSTNGAFSSNHGQRDFWIVRLNESGTMLWQKCYGGASSDTAYSIVETLDGGFAVVGDTYSTGEM